MARKTRMKFDTAIIVLKWHRQFLKASLSQILYLYKSSMP